MRARLADLKAADRVLTPAAQAALFDLVVVERMPRWLLPAARTAGDVVDYQLVLTALKAVTKG